MLYSQHATQWEVILGGKCTVVKLATPRLGNFTKRIDPAVAKTIVYIADKFADGFSLVNHTWPEYLAIPIATKVAEFFLTNCP